MDNLLNLHFNLQNHSKSLLLHETGDMKSARLVSGARHFIA